MLPARESLFALLKALFAATRPAPWPDAPDRVIAVRPDPVRRAEEAALGGSHFHFLRQGLLPHLPETGRVLVLAPGRFDLVRSILAALPQLRLTVIDPGPVPADLAADPRVRPLCLADGAEAFDRAGEALGDLDGLVVLRALSGCEPDLLARLLPALRACLAPGAVAVLHHDDVVKAGGSPAGPGASALPPSRLTARAMAALARAAGFASVADDLGLFRRDGLTVLTAAPLAAAPAENGFTRLLNCGCGGSWHPGWTNVDFVSTSPEHVLAYDLGQGIPFADGSFDAVYSSHMLEHLTRPKAARFLAQARRVLRPGGILRLAVPDFEGLARAYLTVLDAALAGDETAAARHEWLSIELFDQLSRHVGGGEMLAYWRRDPMPAEDYVYARVGGEVKRLVARIRAAGGPAVVPEAVDPLAVGRFRLGGEPHLWMYDRLSLGRLLAEAGFAQIQVVSADQSGITDFGGYGLDLDPDGSVRKPDSLFMEAVR